MVFNKQIYKKLLNDMKTKDVKIYNIIKKHGYVKPTPKRNIYALLIQSIIGQKIRFYEARSLRGKLYTKLGTDDFNIADIVKLGHNGLLNLGIYDWQCDIIIRVTQYIITNKQK